MAQSRSIEGGILAPSGFSAAAVCAGVKKADRLDLALIVSDAGRIPSAAVFTQSSTAAPPVIVSKAAIRDGMISAAVVNSGNANACTGAPGMADATSMAETVADQLACQPHDVVVASTGVIGVPMPMDRISTAISKAAEALSADSNRPQSATAAAEAIMTTDTFVKQCAVSVAVDDAVYRVGGMAKGSGMIHPNMATMLGFVTTDAPLTPAQCDEVLRDAVGLSFNRITVDGDTSTNDMVLLMASGAASEKEIEADSPTIVALRAAVAQVCTELAKMIVTDGEGATKFIEITVGGAASESDAHAAAMSIATSPLFKTAIFGGDANWGRVAMALGNARAAIDTEKLKIVFAGIVTCAGGTAVAFDEDAAAAALAQNEIEVLVDLGVGDSTATVWTCDLSYEYVRINGEYRT